MGCFSPDVDVPSPSESAEAWLKGLQDYLVPITQEMAKSMPISEAARYQTYADYAPKFADIEAGIAENVLPRYTELGKDLREAQMAGDIESLGRYGPQFGEALRGMMTTLEPEFLQVAQPLASKTAELIGGLDPNRLSPTERREIESALARQGVQTGALTAPSQANTVSNAMMFGQGLMDKQLRVSQALGQAAGVAPAVRTGFDPTQAALGRPSITAAWGQYGGPDRTIGSTGQQVGSQIGSQLGQYQAQTNQAMGQFQSNPWYGFGQNVTKGWGNLLGISSLIG